MRNEMYCPICDQKLMNCDCTPEERRMHAEIEDLEEQIPRWIPVTERLPDEYDVVMVGWAGRRDIGKGYLLNGKWHDPFVCKPDVNQPTHWMPLPAPPTDDK